MSIRDTQLFTKWATLCLSVWIAMKDVSEIVCYCGLSRAWSSIEDNATTCRSFWISQQFFDTSSQDSIVDRCMVSQELIQSFKSHACILSFLFFDVITQSFNHRIKWRKLFLPSALEVLFDLLKRCSISADLSCHGSASILGLLIVILKAEYLLVHKLW